MTVTAMPAQDAPASGGETPKKGKKKLILILVGVLVVAGAGYWFFLKPGGAPAAPKPGVVVALDPIQVNLADGHYLKIGIALQAVAGVKEVDGSKALDATIGVFSNRPLSSVMSAENREKLRERLTKKVEHLYEDEVMDVYLTEFVSQ